MVPVIFARPSEDPRAAFRASTVIPVALQDAMSREAQAAREKQARIILLNLRVWG